MKQEAFRLPPLNPVRCSVRTCASERALARPEWKVVSSLRVGRYGLRDGAAYSGRTRPCVAGWAKRPRHLGSGRSSSSRSRPRSAPPCSRRRRRRGEMPSRRADSLRLPPHSCTVACAAAVVRSEEHTSELQSRLHLVCRLLLEKKKKDTRVLDSC